MAFLLFISIAASLAAAYGAPTESLSSIKDHVRLLKDFTRSDTFTVCMLNFFILPENMDIPYPNGGPPKPQGGGQRPQRPPYQGGPPPYQGGPNGPYGRGIVPVGYNPFSNMDLSEDSYENNSGYSNEYHKEQGNDDADFLQCAQQAFQLYLEQYGKESHKGRTLF